MELYTLISLTIMTIQKVDFSNPAWLDLAKMLVGAVSWIGGLSGFLYYRQSKLKKAIA
ncbi:MAG TPA: hypothetical protein VII28_02100 [Puia sp.]